MNKKLYKLMDWPEIEAIVYSESLNPYNVLGAKIIGNNVLFQTFVPDAKEISLITIINGVETSYDMEMADEEGFFACIISGKKIPQYEYEINKDGEKFRIKDAYSYRGFEIDEKTLKKFESGILYDSYNYFGAHKCVINGQEGVRFALWAPNAIGCSLIGDFNNYTNKMYQMKKNEKTGVFEIFIPNVNEGDKYLYSIKVKGGEYVEKLDPYSSVISLDEKAYSQCFFSEYHFSDDKYLKSRSKYKKDDSRISVYEVNLGYFKRGKKNSLLNYKELGKSIAEYVKEMNYTHVDLMPLLEYTKDSSFGYQTKMFYALTNRYGTPDDFKAMIDILHQNDIGVIMDFAPYHFSCDCDGLLDFDGTCLYEHLDPKKGVHPFFGTKMFNYGRKEVSNFLISSALNLVKEYHIDGLRLDGVSSMIYLDYGRAEGDYIPNIYGGNENLEGIEFIKHLNSIMNKENKDVLMIANDDSLFPMVTESLDKGGLGFDLKINKGMTDDFLNYISYDPYFRSHHHNELTDNMLYQYSDNLISSLSHEYFIYDQGSLFDRMPGEEKDKFNNLKLSLAFLFLHPGKKCIFAGQDIGVSGPFFEDEIIDWSITKKESNKGVKNLVCDLNKLYQSYDELSLYDNSEKGFEWINCIDSEKNMISFLRKGKTEENVLLVVFNFANVLQNFSIGSSIAGKYKEILNSDSKEYAGSNVVNRGYKPVSEIGMDGRTYSVDIKLAPLSMSVLKFVPFTDKEKYQIEKKKEAVIAKTKAQEYEEEAKTASADYEEAKIKLEEAKKLMKDAEQRIKKALEKKEAELLKAKKALEEAN